MRRLAILVQSWLVLFVGWTASHSKATEPLLPPKDVVDCYMPVEGGWQIRISADPNARRLKPGEIIGVVGQNDLGGHRGSAAWTVAGRVADDPRAHRRPLYPPADRRLVWTQEELASRQRIPFRPIVLAANDARFLIDMDSAGGLSGHLRLGLSLEHGPSKWIDQFSDFEVRYVDGRMEYGVHDSAFPGIKVRLVAMPLAESVGLVMRVRVEGASRQGELMWTFGGASGLTTNYDHNSPMFRFSPEQCDDNVVRGTPERFTLLRKDQLVIQGGSSWSAVTGAGDPKKVLDSPAALCASTQWSSATKRMAMPKCVAVQRVPIGTQPAEGWIVLGRGGKLESFLANPSAAEELARARSRSMVSRVTVRTPDPYLNQAMPMMALATDGIWGDAAMVHGGWSWRQAYLGWRIWYGPLCYGWTDRVKRCIEQHSTLGLIREGPDKGALAHMLESPGPPVYNMNEVFTDHVRQYFEYTDDVELMRKIFPVLQGIAEWEGRRLQPDKAVPLYESSLDTWISDSHWYIGGQCTTASAYMLGAHRLLAELAEALGEDPAPYRQKAAAIRSAMQQTLWQPRRGVFAEYRDTLGERQLHPEPELATIYHSAEFGAASPLQVYEMLHWVDSNLRSESTPGGGRAYWSSNWAPNAGRSYTHSTYEMAYAEELNLALTHYLVGRADDAYAILRGALCGIYNGPAPGGLSCHMYADGRQRHNNEFADSISMWGRTVVEGMYGIRPKRSRGRVDLSPQFPTAWPEASIRTLHFSYRWRRNDRQVIVEWESPIATAVRLRLPLRAQQIEQVAADGKPIAYEVEPGVGLSWLIAESSRAVRGIFAVSYAPAGVAAGQSIRWKEGDRVTLRLDDHAAQGFLDPQGILANVRLGGGILEGIVAGEPGDRLLLIKSGTTACPFWAPRTVHIEPKLPVAKRIWSPPVETGKNLERWALVDLSRVFNASVTEALGQVARAAQPPPAPALAVNHNYWKEHITARVAAGNPSDAAWRRKIGQENIGWTHDGIPFKSAKQGKNVAVVTRAGGFPSKLEVPIGAAGKELYLMVTGMAFPSQSHVVNVRLTLHDANGTAERIDLVNPVGIGDCWGTWLGRFHDTPANGFENLGGRFGPPGSSAVGDLTRPVAVDTEAHLMKIPLRQGANVRAITLEAVANDVIFGLMGASLSK